MYMYEMLCAFKLIYQYWNMSIMYDTKVQKWLTCQIGTFFVFYQFFQIKMNLFSCFTYTANLKGLDEICGKFNGIEQIYRNVLFYVGDWCIIIIKINIPWVIEEKVVRHILPVFLVENIQVCVSWTQVIKGKMTKTCSKLAQDERKEWDAFINIYTHQLCLQWSM